MDSPTCRCNGFAGATVVEDSTDSHVVTTSTRPPVKDDARREWQHLDNAAVYMLVQQHDVASQRYRTNVGHLCALMHDLTLAKA